MEVWIVCVRESLLWSRCWQRKQIISDPKLDCHLSLLPGKCDERTGLIIFVVLTPKTYRRSSRGQVGSFEHLDGIAWPELGSASRSGDSARSLGAGVVARGPSLGASLRSGPGSGGSWSITWSLRSRTVAWSGAFATAEKSANATKNGLY